MLKSYEVAIEGDRITWLGEKPNLQTTRAIIVIAEENKDTQIRRRSPSKAIVGKGKTLGDIVSPIVDEEDWKCLK
jgi:hypothetical protein